jgi:WD40 repeat protein
MPQRCFVGIQDAGDGPLVRLLQDLVDVQDRRVAHADSRGPSANIFGRPIAVLASRPSDLFRLSFGHDGTRLLSVAVDAKIDASGYRGGCTQVWDVDSGRQRAQFPGFDARFSFDGRMVVAFSRDGTRLVSGSGDYTVRVWDALPPRSEGGARAQATP